MIDPDLPGHLLPGVGALPTVPGRPFFQVVPVRWRHGWRHRAGRVFHVGFVLGPGQDALLQRPDPGLGGLEVVLTGFLRLLLGHRTLEHLQKRDAQHGPLAGREMPTGEVLAHDKANDVGLGALAPLVTRLDAELPAGPLAGATINEKLLVGGIVLPGPNRLQKAVLADGFLESVVSLRVQFRKQLARRVDPHALHLLHVPTGLGNDG